MKISNFKFHRNLGKVLLSLIVFATLAAIFARLTVPPAAAAWFDDTWQYRTQYAIGNSGGAVTNQKVLLQINTAILMGAGKLQYDCGDSRFTDGSGNLLKYYVNVSGGAGVGCNDTSTDYYVLMPAINGSNADTLIFHYYGNPGAVNGTVASQFTEATFSPTSGPTAETEEKTIGPSYHLKFDEQYGTTIYNSVTASASGELYTVRDDFTRADSDTVSTYMTERNGGGTSDWDISSNRVTLAVSDTSGPAFTTYITTWSTSRLTNYIVEATINYPNDASNDRFLGVVGRRVNFSTGDADGYFALADRETGDVNLYRRVSGTSTLLGEATVTINHSTNYKIALSMHESVIKLYWDGVEKVSANDTNLTAAGDAGLSYGFGTSCTACTWDSFKAKPLYSENLRVWEPPDSCTQNSCYFNDGGANVFIQVDNPNLPTGDFTIAVWARQTNPGASDSLINVYSTSQTHDELEIQFDSTGVIQFVADASTVLGSTRVDDGRWHYVVAQRSGSTMKLYVDGKHDKSGTEADTLIFDGCPLLIGLENDSGGDGGCTGAKTGVFDGFIDELKVYNYALSEAQIKANYLRGSSDIGSSAAFGKSTDDWISSGLRGYWKLDETGSNAPVDIGGFAIDLTRRASPSMAVAKFGNGADLESTTNETYFTRSDEDVSSITGSLSVVAWIKPESNTAATQYNTVCKWVGSNQSYCFAQYGDELRMYVDSSSNYVETTVANLATATWYHVVGVYNAASQSVQIYVNGIPQATTVSGTIPASIGDDTSIFHIGAQDFDGVTVTTATNGYDGILDEVRLYSRALSHEEARKLYEWAPGPILHLKYDENTGGSTGDSSEYNHSTSFCQHMDNNEWSPGKYGSALNFQGTGASDIECVDFETTPFLDKFSTSQGTVEAWVKIDPGAWTDSTGRHAVSVRVNADNEIIISKTSANTFSVEYEAANITELFTYDDTGDTGWIHAALTWDVAADTVKGYFNGMLDSTETALGTWAGTIIDAVSGSQNVSGSNSWNGLVDEVKIYNYPRTQKQVIEDMNAGHPAPGSPVGSPIAYFKLDEGYGDAGYNTVNNITVFNLNLGGTGNTCPGATTCPTWTTSGKINMALDFDGTNDYASLGDNKEYELTTDMTFSAWIKADTIADAEYIVDRSNAGSELEADNELYSLRWDTTSGNDLEYSHENGAGTDNARVFDVNLSAGTWYHVAFTRDTAANTVKLYVDGRLSGTFNYTADPTGGTAGSTLIASQDDVALHFDGIIDEIKIYQFALTDAEIKMDFNQASSSVLGSYGTTTSGAGDWSAQRAYCPPGNTEGNCGGSNNPSPVGHWTMDENNGATVYDKSENSNDLTREGDPQWVTGKIGSGLDFNGNAQCATDDVTSGAGATGDVSVSAWVYRKSTSTDDFIVELNGTDETEPENMNYRLYINNDDNVLRLEWEYSTALNELISSTTGLTNSSGRWVHVAAVRDVTANTVKFYENGVQLGSTVSYTNDPTGGASDQRLYIGSDGPTCNSTVDTFDGKIDDIRVYNYARTPAQIAWDYNRGAPIAHYKFDECQGTTAYNSTLAGSGAAAGNNGTISAGTAGDNTSVGSCSSAVGTEMWNNGTTGKRNSSLDFDGDATAANADRVEVADNSSLDFIDSQDFSLEVWINRASFTTDDTILAKRNSTTNTDAGYILWLDATNDDLNFEVSEGSNGTNDEFSINARTAITASGWYHVVVVFDEDSATNSTIYVNGVNDKESTTGTIGNVVSLANAVALQIGGESDEGNSFDGQIDEVKLYNYALTSTQVRTLYNEGASVRFGPATGSP